MLFHNVCTGLQALKSCELHITVREMRCSVGCLQENSAVWLGDFDFDKMDFVGNGAYFHFPRNDHCDQIYCNVEVTLLHHYQTTCNQPL
jgi:hypothetical protein